MFLNKNIFINKLVLLIPNFITISRIFALPMISFLFYHQNKTYGIFAGFLFGIFAATDCLDGYLARKLKIESNFGKCMDPIADKVFFIYPLLFFLHTKYIFFIFIFIAREFFISELRILSLHNKKKIHVINLSKWKTVIQFTGISFLISKNHFLFKIGLMFMFIAIILSIKSLFDYTKANKGILNFQYIFYSLIRMINLFLLLLIGKVDSLTIYVSLLIIFDVFNLGLHEYYLLRNIKNVRLLNNIPLKTLIYSVLNCFFVTCIASGNFNLLFIGIQVSCVFYIFSLIFSITRLISNC